MELAENKLISASGTRDEKLNVIIETCFTTPGYTEQHKSQNQSLHDHRTLSRSHTWAEDRKTSSLYYLVNIMHIDCYKACFSI